MKKEIWKIIPNFETHEISNTGMVRNIKTGYILKQSLNRQGYHNVYLRNQNGKSTLRVHRLVAINFIENCLNKPEVNHKDCNKSNNDVSNLEWVTPKENSIHSAKNGRLPDNRGEKSACSKLTNLDVLFIRESVKCDRIPVTKLHRNWFPNVSLSTIYAITQNRTWKHISI